ncbi:MAG: PA14 domain-containing protein [Anaerolineae bacterium]
MKPWVKILWLIAGIAVLTTAGVLLLLTARSSDSLGEISVSPSIAAPGGPIIVQGSGWKAGTPLIIALREAIGATQETVVTSTTADERGRFVVSFLLPSSAPWDSIPRAIVVAHRPGEQAGATYLLKLQPHAPEPTPTHQPLTPTTMPPEATAWVPTREPTSAPATPVQPTATPTAQPSPQSTATATPTPSLTPTPLPGQLENAWWAEYYAYADLRGSPTLVRWESSLDWDWGSGPPDPGLPSDRFSARWQGRWRLSAGAYRFTVTVDDGARLWLDGHLLLDQWQEGGARTYTLDARLPEGVHDLRLDYFEKGGLARVRLAWTSLGAAGDTLYPNWRAEYFDNRQLAHQPRCIVNDPALSFAWGSGSPGLGLPADNFSVRWSAKRTFAAGWYRFHVEVDDGARLWLGTSLILDEWHDSPGTHYAIDRYLGGDYTVWLEYYEHAGNARVRLWWEPIAAPTATATATRTGTPTPTCTQTPTATRSVSPTLSPTATGIPTATWTPTPSPTPSATATEPTNTPSASATTIPSETPTVTPTT